MIGPRFIDGASVRGLLRMEDCIDAMSEAMVASATGSLQMPLRQSVSLNDGSGSMLIMPGCSTDLPVFGVKVLSVMENNPSMGRPTVQGVILLFDHLSGEVIAVLDAATITLIRTAAASGLATRLLARVDTRTCGILGTGPQAEAHVEAILCVRPGIEQVVVWGRNWDRAAQCVAAISARFGRSARAVRRPQEAAACDVVTTVTSATNPVLLGEWLRPGSHVNLVGSHSPNAREADTEAIRRCDVYVDSMQSALVEAGDLLIPMREGAFRAEDIRAEIGAVACGLAMGRANADVITLYKSLGVFAQDLYAAWRVARLAGCNLNQGADN